MEMTLCEKYEKFINENTDITLKFMIWEEKFLEPQIFSNDVKVEAEDVEAIEITTGKSNVNYGTNNS